MNAPAPAVTDVEVLSRAPFDSCNAERLSELESLLVSLCGPPPSDEQRIAREREFQAQKTGQSCGGCGRVLPPTEALYIYRRYSNLYRARSHVTRRGECCITDDDIRKAIRWERPCAGCGRTTYRRYSERWDFEYHDGSPGRRWFCSTGCSSAAYRAARRKPKLARPCAGCGTSFSDTRADARFCSGACRQRAYRAKGKEVFAGDEIEAAVECLKQAVEIGKNESLQGAEVGGEVLAQRQQVAEEVIDLAHRIKIEALVEIGQLMAAGAVR